jgi:Zn-dependent protease with chaperone function
LLVLLPVWGAATAVSWSLGDFAYAELTGVAAGLALSLVTLRAVAYRTELDADAVAVRLAPRVAAVVPGVPARPHEAAEELAEALLAVTADHPDARKATWLHPSIDQRVATLRRTVTARRSVSAGAPGAVLPATMPMASEELASRSSLDP